jgi:hypothetical protein
VAPQNHVAAREFAGFAGNDDMMFNKLELCEGNPFFVQAPTMLHFACETLQI